MRDAGRGLRELLPAAAFGPRTLLAVAGNRDIGDAMRDMRERSGREAELRKRARPVRIHKDMRPAYEAAQRLGIGGLHEIEEGRTLSMPGVERVQLYRIKTLSAHIEHLGAVGGERAPAGGSRQHAGQIEHPDGVERILRVA